MGGGEWNAVVDTEFEHAPYRNASTLCLVRATARGATYRALVSKPPGLPLAVLPQMAVASLARGRKFWSAKSFFENS